MKTIKGDILTVKRGVIVHGCNSMGKFDKGLAKHIRQTYPIVYNDYMNQFTNIGLRVGDVVISKISDELYIVSAIIQKYYGNDKSVRYVSYDGLKECFNKINNQFKDYNLPIYVPSIGAGLANGDFSIIKNIIENTLDKDLKIIHVIKD